MSSDDPVKLTRKGRICIVTLDSRRGTNVLSTEMLTWLGGALEDIERDDRVRAVVITGEGNFSAGADVGEMRDMSAAQAQAFSMLGQEVCNRIEALGKAVIAAIEGYAFGGGCELALACDLRIAGEGAKFGQLEINLGIMPGFGGTFRLARAVGIGKAKEMILTGSVIGAKEAESIGLVNRIVPAGKAVQVAGEIAGTISEKSAAAVRAAKRLMTGSVESRRAMDDETAAFSECFSRGDAREGMTAFLEKRTPRFEGL